MENNKGQGLKSAMLNITVAVIGTVLSTFIIAKFSGCFESKSAENKAIVVDPVINKEDRAQKIFSILESYASDLNARKFDAYKYFSSKIDLFFQMKDTDPKKINDYVNVSFNKQFKNSSTRFDKNTLSIREIDGRYEATIIAYSTYYNVAKKQQFTNFRTRVELRFDKDFRIKYLREFLD